VEGGEVGRCGILPTSPSEVRAWHHQMVELAELMTTADSLRLTAYGSDGTIRVVESGVVLVRHGQLPFTKFRCTLR